MTTQETVKVSAELILTTEHGEVPGGLGQLILDQMSGELDEDTGLTCIGVDVVAVTGELDSPMSERKRTITITLDSALTDDQWNKFVEEVEQAACDFAAASPDDRYHVTVQNDDQS
jgi:hypothetical protein